MSRAGVLRAGRRLLLHSRTQMAVKSALAAALSWLAAEGVARAVSELGFDIEDYVYYGPLGAVVATYPTVAASLRTARSTGLAMAMGAAVGLAGHYLGQQDPQGQLNVLALALVVGLGVALGAIPGVGAQSSWVPIVALFVLIIGGEHAISYAAAYVGLTGLGMVCGVLVNLALPAMRLSAGQEALEGLRESLAQQLAGSADALRRHPGHPATELPERTRDPVLAAQQTREALQQVLDARRANPRARRHVHDIDRQQHLAHVLQRVAVLVEDLPELLSGTEEGAPGAKLDHELTELTADALDGLADLVRAYDTDLRVDDPRVDDAEEAVQRLTAAFGRRRAVADADIAVIGAVVANLRRSLAAVLPAAPE